LVDRIQKNYNVLMFLIYERDFKDLELNNSGFLLFKHLQPPLFFSCFVAIAGCGIQKKKSFTAKCWCLTSFAVWYFFPW